MKVVQKSYSVELTEADVGMLVDALHASYKAIKSEAQDIASTSVSGVSDIKLGNKLCSLRAMRNDLAGLIGRSFMGEDA